MTSSARNSTISVRRGVVWSVRKTFTASRSPIKLQSKDTVLQRFKFFRNRFFEFGFHTYRKIVVSGRCRSRVFCRKLFNSGKTNIITGIILVFLPNTDHPMTDAPTNDMSYRRRLTIAVYKIFKNINIDYKIFSTADIIYRCW